MMLQLPCHIACHTVCEVLHGAWLGLELECSPSAELFPCVSNRQG